jgi:hypothetical protein
MTRLQVSSLVLVRNNTRDIHSAGEMREELYRFTASDTWLGGGGARCDMCSSDRLCTVGVGPVRRGSRANEGGPARGLSGRSHAASQTSLTRRRQLGSGGVAPFHRAVHTSSDVRGNRKGATVHHHRRHQSLQQSRRIDHSDKGRPGGFWGD